MIYEKEASFPYPILSPNTNNYRKSQLNFVMEDIKENSSSYIFYFKFSFGHGFINELYSADKIKAILIISSNDHYFVELKKTQTKIEVPKKRLSLSSRTNLQIQLHSKTEIELGDCEELNDFFEGFKNEIKIPKNSLIGYSDTETFLGTGKTSLILFERSINENYQYPFTVELGEKTIVLKFNSSKYFMNIGPNSSLMNMYYYIGLSRALEQFIRILSNGDEEIDLESISQIQDNELNQKLLDLLINKGVTVLNFDNLDEVIHEISDNIVEKFYDGISEVTNRGN